MEENKEYGKEEKAEVKNHLQESSLGLKKNSKGYTWEIKIYGNEKELFDKVVALNVKMLEKYGGVKE